MEGNEWEKRREEKKEIKERKGRKGKGSEGILKRKKYLYITPEENDQKESPKAGKIGRIPPNLIIS